MMTLKNILVVTDFSEASEAALVYARELAQAFGGTFDSPTSGKCRRARRPCSPCPVLGIRLDIARGRSGRI